MLTDFERKLMRIIENNNIMARETSIEDLTMRTGHGVDDVMRTIQKLADEKRLIRKGRIFEVRWK